MKEEIFGRHLMDLAKRAFDRNSIFYSDFLGLNELNIFHGMQRELSFIRSVSRGGYADAERQMIAFIPDAFYYAEEDGEIPFPIAFVRIAPADRRFTDPLSHRDYLGALLNLGIERGLLGDILVGDDGAVVICRDNIADFIAQSLTRVRHSTVSCEPVDESVVSAAKPKLLPVSGSVASARLDALLALAFRLPRSQAAALVSAGKVFADGRLVTDPSFHPKECTILSCRGKGRFRFDGTGKVTKKGRVVASLSLYAS